MSREQTMLIVGDVFVRREDPPSVFQHVKDFMRSADFMLGNLEGSVADSGTSRKKTGAAAWKADSRQITAIETGGFHAVTVANNHMMDYGVEALLETLKNLDRVGVKHTGGGSTYAEAHAPAIVERDGTTVAMLGLTCVFFEDWEAGPSSPGLATIKAQTSYQPSPRYFEVPGSPPIIRSWVVPEYKEQLAADVAAARKLADIVICTFHWGVSAGFQKLTEYQVELGRHAIDCGADLVFGHHPHLMQGIEVRDGRPIFYSLGNFSFARMDRAKGHEFETMFVRCRIRDRKIHTVEFVPVCCDEHLDPHLLDLKEGRRAIEIVEERSRQFGTKLVAAGDAMRVVLQAAQREAA